MKNRTPRDPRKAAVPKARQSTPVAQKAGRKDVAAARQTKQGKAAAKHGPSRAVHATANDAANEADAPERQHGPQELPGEREPQEHQQRDRDDRDKLDDRDEHHRRAEHHERPAAPAPAPTRRLDVFPNPSAGRDYVIQFVVPEFTCNCPLTGQPDFAHFTIEMVADKLCIELKSLKLYFWSYRNVGAFHEKVTNDIVDDIVRATDPRFVRITAKWNVRGGIYTHIVAEHRQRGWQPPQRVELAGAPPTVLG